MIRIQQNNNAVHYIGNSWLHKTPVQWVHWPWWAEGHMATAPFNPCVPLNAAAGGRSDPNLCRSRAPRQLQGPLQRRPSASQHTAESRGIWSWLPWRCWKPATLPRQPRPRATHMMPSTRFSRRRCLKRGASRGTSWTRHRRTRWRCSRRRTERHCWRRWSGISATSLAMATASRANGGELPVTSQLQNHKPICASHRQYHCPVTGAAMVTVQTSSAKCRSFLILLRIYSILLIR